MPGRLLCFPLQVFTPDRLIKWITTPVWHGGTGPTFWKPSGREFCDCTLLLNSPQ